MTLKTRLGIAFAVVFGVVMVAILVVSIPTPTPPLSLKFQRYGVATSADGGQLVCYLILTNASKSSYRVFLNGTNALGSDASIMINCEYSEETTNGWTNWTEHLSGGSLRIFQLSPHSSATIRVPAPEGMHARKVAALCVLVPRQLPRILELARRIWWRIVRPQATLYKAWCDQELFRENSDRPAHIETNSSIAHPASH